ncbi:MAG: pyridoxamine 5'-phosphate oxidase family protein [Dehalococcoidales bacterium]
MAKMPPEVMEFFRESLVAKVVATEDKNGELNVSPKGSLVPLDEETLAYADLYGPGSRTHQNLLATGKASVMAYRVTATPPFTAYQVKGHLGQSLTSGPVFETVAGPIVAMGMEVKAVNTIKVDKVSSESPLEPGKKLG